MNSLDPAGVLIYEIFSDGRESLYRKMTIRELLYYLSSEVHKIDDSAATNSNHANKDDVNERIEIISSGNSRASFKQNVSLIFLFLYAFKSHFSIRVLGFQS